MYQFQKNGKFADKLLSTLMSSDDELPWKCMIYLNSPELLSEKHDKKCDVKLEEWCRILQYTPLSLKCKIPAI